MTHESSRPAVLWSLYGTVVLITALSVRSRPPPAVGPDRLSFRCRFNSSTLPMSTRRDVALLFTTHFSVGVELCIRSLRSSGSECRIVLFLGPVFSPPRRFSSLIEALEVEAVWNCTERKGRAFVPHLLRYEYERLWLEAHIGEIDRVLHTDALDVFFQGDPFASGVTADSLVFVVEPHAVRACGWNLGWIYECYGPPMLNRMLSRFIVCSGSIAGGAVPYLRLIRLMMEQPQWAKCWKASMDQPILNVLLWEGTVAAAGLAYRLAGCHSGFFTVQWCVIERRVSFNRHGQVVSSLGRAPSYVHQYDRVPELAAHFYRRCKVK
jgi:hypothetical protein